MTRPEVLFRGTPSTEVGRFEPKELIDDTPVVSATSDEMFATMFVVPMEDLNVKIGRLNDRLYYLCADKEKFTYLDVGGAIYSLPTDGFEPAPKIGPDVWVNANPVTPLSKEDIPSALEAMIKAGVKVYFVAPEMLEKFINNPDKRPEILQSLVPETLESESK